ncbi:MAG: aminotransferase class III-fold pyridoxal phosphate-dependent enzyme [Rubrivivax sp.]|nr:aminotransferase class III-fold pyridoxal phosphate-dependent enzyme [Rubrivivax sp.]
MTLSPEALRAANARHMLHPMIDPKVVAGAPPLILERADGVHVWDVDGQRYLDTVASLWNVNVGHNRPEVKRAIVEQLDRMAYWSTFQNTSNPPAIELSQRLMRLFAPERMARVLFSSGGSDAVETALKLARQYWQLEGQSQRSKFISLKLGYHGVHFGGASINGNPLFRAAYEPLLPGCFQVEAPYLYRNPWGETDPARLAARCADELDRAIAYQGPRTVAAFVAEPVQGAGGVIVPHESFWPAVRRVCDRHGVLLIADEVVTGFGRIGAMSGARAWGVAPDLMALAKGINSGYVPLGATLINERVAAAFDRPGQDAALMHGYTYSGHALACAAANANLDIVEHEDLPARAAQVGAHLCARLAECLRWPHVGDVRGKGLMAAVELVTDRDSRNPLMVGTPYVQALVAAARREGALVRVQGNRLILSPPLVFTDAHVDETLRILHAAFEHAEATA